MSDNKILLILFSIIVLLYGVRAAVEASLSSGTQEVAELRDEIVTLQAKNGDLYEQVLQAESLQTINDKARRMGFVDVQYVYIH